jgi:hypothetical protein
VAAAFGRQQLLGGSKKCFPKVPQRLQKENNYCCTEIQELNSMSPPVMLHTFTFFPKLPMELQNLIWQMTLSEPRVISRENCFREWWYGKLVSFLSPVALHVCHSSRSLARGVLRSTSIHIPGLPGWRPFYINQACDFFTITKSDVQLNVVISDFIADPAVVRRVLILGVLSSELCLEKDIRSYLDQFSRLEEVAIAENRPQRGWLI